MGGENGSYMCMLEIGGGEAEEAEEVETVHQLCHVAWEGRMVHTCAC